MGEYAVYILECADGTLYTGITTDVTRRVAEHNGEHGMGKGAKYTKVRRPVVLRYSESCGTKGQALRREYALKSLSRTEKLALLSA
jgi:putative endonuclease